MKRTSVLESLLLEKFLNDLAELTLMLSGVCKEPVKNVTQKQSGKAVAGDVDGRFRKHYCPPC